MEEEEHNNEEDFETLRNLHVFHVIEEDSIPELSKLMETSDVTSTILSPHETRSDEMLRYKPNTISVAAFNRSINSFRYLLINGSNLDEKDEKIYSPFLVFL